MLNHLSVVLVVCTAPDAVHHCCVSETIVEWQNGKQKQFIKLSGIKAAAHIPTYQTTFIQFRLGLLVTDKKQLQNILQVETI